MDTGMDLSHVQKQIQKDTAKVKELRSEAETRRRYADQRYREENPDGAKYYEQEGARLEQQADELEDEITQLEAQAERLKARITELEKQRAAINTEHTEHLFHIDDELRRLKGSGMML